MPFFDLSRRIVIESLETDPRLVDFLRHQLAPFPSLDAPPDGRPADVVLSPSIEGADPIVEEHRAADDRLTTAADGSRLFVLADDLRCSIPDALEPGPIRFDHDPAFPLWRIFRSAVRPAMQVGLAAAGR